MLLYYLAWRQVLQVALSILVAYWFYQRFCSARGIPQSIPWAGVDDKGVRARILATARSLFGTRGLLEEAYRKYGKEGIPFVLPNVISGPEVVVPQSMMDWLLHHPDNVLDQAEVNRDFLQADYTMLHPKVIHDAVHSDYIRKELTKNLGEYTGDVLEEIDYAFRKCWGTDSENWTCVVAYDSMSEIIARISNRVLVGLPLCRDENYLYSSSRFARWVILEASVLHMLPNHLRPIFAPFVTISDYRHYIKMAKFIIPVWAQRVAAPIVDYKKKRDYIQFCLDNANDARDPDERGSGMISKRLSAISFAAIQSSVITSCNLILDLAASPLTPVVLSTIKQEVLTELKEEGGSWTKGFLSRIVTCDSVLRESMRLWGFVSRGVLKTVVAKEGVDLPGYGRIPCGTKIGVHAYPVHHDDKIYPQANTFQPFRFCKLGDTVTTDDGTMVQQKHVSTPLVTTSNNWMAFSHGKHACPGRYFAAQQLKLVLAYIALNYEIHPIPERPANRWLVGSSGPPLKHVIHIRRLKGTT